MSTSSTSESPEGEEQGRRLIIRACDMCRKKKIRCEPTAETCVQCIKYRTLCHFTPISVKRKPRRPPEQKRVEELEKRLKSMEEQLQRANQSKEVVRIVDEQGALDNLWDEGLSNFECRISLEGSDIPRVRKTLLDMDPIAEHRFATNPDWKITNFSTMFSRKVFKSLPSKPEAIALVNKAFEGFNLAFPIFDQHDAMAMLNYPDGGHQEPSHWACLNVVLAIAHRFRSMRKMDNEFDDREAWGYLQNALAVAPELTLLEAKISSVQALIGMAVVIQGTPNPRPFGTLVSQAIRMAQNLGLHRKNRDPNLTPREVEQRKRVFWTAYFIDKEHCLRTGEPPAQDDEEMDIEMPSEMMDNMIQFGATTDVNYFTFRVKLALIQGQVYRRLISVKAEKQSVTRRMVEVKRLEGMLAVWRASIPINFSENYKVPGRGRPLIPPIIHKVILRMNYFNTLNTIHRFSVPVEKWRSQLQEPIDPDAGSKHSPPPPILCVEEARNAITLMHITPNGDYSCIWVILHMFVQAATTLLENIISDPSHHRAPADLKLIEPLLILLCGLAKDGRNEEVAAMYQSCGAMFEKTREMVRNATTSEEQRNSSRKGGDIGQGSESLAEFLRRIDTVSAGLDEEGMALVESPAVNELEMVDFPTDFPYLGANNLAISRLGWHVPDGY
ncbi:hypothetical protein L207DRAFT_457834 [Hyaloscypha variabilis F]|uniref:Zn(2)-C6 fungal-type domain-containing protein n=1 Tax=Hyaloscypha variabilis (strain UAMH 11265 / GT02V1 / F) TaxID=1149755 RepID=A0A2J6RS99_HYAVF|nr:hypothetical protein L207DRAFT_457834 [Hyaloscypha variabilis F]